jgi:hypothetical protein
MPSVDVAPKLCGGPKLHQGASVSAIRPANANRQALTATVTEVGGGADGRHG